MADTGWVVCGASTDLDDVDKIAWVNLSNIHADDGNFAQATKQGTGPSDTIKAFTYSLSIPTGATIDGIEVRVEARQFGSTGNVQDVNVYDGDSTPGTEKTPGETMTGSFANYDYGGASDLWGLTLTEADVEDSEFQVRWQFGNIGQNDAVRVDHCAIKVYYTEAASFLPFFPRRQKTLLRM